MGSIITLGIFPRFIRELKRFVWYQVNYVSYIKFVPKSYLLQYYCNSNIAENLMNKGFE